MKKTKLCHHNFPLDPKKVYIVADFDRTLTEGSSMTSWSILSNFNLVSDQYNSERQKLYEIYRPIEIATDLEEEYKMAKVKEWFQAHINLFVKFKLPENVIEEACLNKDIMRFRKGVKEFLQFLKEQDIPLIIISAGIGNFIKSFLKQNDCYYENIFICSNMIEFENGIATGVGKNIIHSLNKNEVALPEEVQEKLKDRHQTILLGDQISDLKMVKKEKLQDTIKVAFLTTETREIEEEYHQKFDIVCDVEDSYEELRNALF